MNVALFFDGKEKGALDLFSRDVTSCFYPAPCLGESASSILWTHVAVFLPPVEFIFTKTG